MSGLLYKQADSEWSTSRNWYNNRVMDTFISSPIVDKQGDMIPTETLKESMNFYMKYGIYAYKHDEIPIGQPLAWRIKDGKVLLKVGIHNKLDMHDKIWKEIQQFGSNGASSIRGEALSQNQVCPPGESCFTKIDKLGLWSVSWVGDSPANPEATVQTVSMAKEDENIGSIVSEKELECNSHIKKCGECSKPVEKCGKCNKPVEKALPVDQLLKLLEVEAGNLSNRLQNLLAPSSKITNLAKKLEAEAKGWVQEGGARGQRQGTEYYHTTREVKGAAKRVEDLMSVAKINTDMVQNLLYKLKRLRRSDRMTR